MIPPFATSIIPNFDGFNKRYALILQRFQAFLVFGYISFFCFAILFLNPNFYMKKSVHVSELTFSVPSYFNASRLFLVQLKTSATGGIPTVRWTAGQPFLVCSCDRCGCHREYSFPCRSFILLPDSKLLIRSRIPCENSTEISKFRVRFQDFK